MTGRRSSILVIIADPEEEPKNSLKGISMKSLVLALNAQFGVGAGGKDIRPCGLRAASNGMENPFLLLWRPVFVAYPDSLCGKGALRLRIEPALRCHRCCVQSSLP